MDVFLTAEAERSLKALAWLSPSGLCGFLIGHRRGPRYFIESAVPAEKNFSFSCAHYLRVDRLFEGKTAGFFFLGAGKTAKNRILKPFAVGKLCLDGHLDRWKKPLFKAYAVDYDGKFYFSPLPLAMFLER